MVSQESGRSRAREFALSVLYAAEFHEDVEQVFEDLLQTPNVGGEIDPFARRLVSGVREHRVAIDAAIVERLQNLTIDRLATVDRIVLRMGACELLFFDDVPAKVVLDEAVELAKRFGGPRSGNFVNGVLDALAPR